MSGEIRRFPGVERDSSREEKALERCRGGDIEGLGVLYEIYSQRVFRTCLRIVGDRESATDLTQEVFLQVFRRLDRFEGRSAFSTWLYRVTVNHCLNRVRARRRRQGRVASLEEVRHVADPAPGPERLRRRSEAGEEVQRLLDRLRPEHRVILVLREIEELTYAEIAEALDIPRGTVMSRLHRARNELLKAGREGNREVVDVVETGDAAENAP